MSLAMYSRFLLASSEPPCLNSSCSATARTASRIVSASRRCRAKRRGCRSGLLGIGEFSGGVAGGTHLVSGREHQGAVHGFEGPALPYEFQRQPIEQFGMRGALAEQAGKLSVEPTMPVPKCQRQRRLTIACARGERMVRARQPVRQFAIGRFAGLEWASDFRRTGCGENASALHRREFAGCRGCEFSAC